jgi:hypothetical protein
MRQRNVGRREKSSGIGPSSTFRAKPCAPRRAWEARLDIETVLREEPDYDGDGARSRFTTSKRATGWIISCRAPPCEPSLPLQHALWHEPRGPLRCEHGVPPFRECPAS